MWSVMPSYNAMDGVPAHANRWLLTKVLRGRVGISRLRDLRLGRRVNELGLHHVAANLKQAGELALRAGVDVERWTIRVLSHAVRIAPRRDHFATGD